VQVGGVARRAQQLLEEGAQALLEIRQTRRVLQERARGLLGQRHLEEAVDDAGHAGLQSRPGVLQPGEVGVGEADVGAQLVDAGRVVDARHVPSWRLARSCTTGREEDVAP
jgi:hypothetical protein